MSIVTARLNEGFVVKRMFDGEVVQVRWIRAHTAAQAIVTFLKDARVVEPEAVDA